MLVKKINIETYGKLLHMCIKKNSELENTFLDLLIHVIKQHIKKKNKGTINIKFEIVVNIGGREG